MKLFKQLLIIALIGLVGAGAFIYSGVFPMGADDPHNALVFWVLEKTRVQAIDNASKDIEVPPLDDPELLLAGGADYNDMCATCHLQPGQEESDLSIGLYPTPPNLSLAEHDEDHKDASDEEKARQWFWTIKHGVKASGMPAWGRTHDDERIWAMVAFLARLPDLTPEQYQILTARD